jgi:DNA processing protein
MAEDLVPSPTPFTPPTTEEDRLSCLRLIRSRRVGPATFHRLCSAHGSVAAALAALPEIARAAGVDDYAVCTAARAEAEWSAGQHAGAYLILWTDAAYPAGLRDLPDAPPLLWAVGDAALLARPAVALVGARNASSLGIRMARRLAIDIGAAGLVVVSGLARGIDTAAHTAALETGTIAVLAGGIDTVYPSENTALALRIAETGLLLSEAPVGQEPQARHFPARNRIVAALARAVIVAEGAARSGSLITARAALDLGREVMAVPGHPLDPRAAGCNALLRDGAALVRHGADVLETLRTSGLLVERDRATIQPEAPLVTTAATDRQPLAATPAAPAAHPRKAASPHARTRATPAATTPDVPGLADQTPVRANPAAAHDVHASGPCAKPPGQDTAQLARAEAEAPHKAAGPGGTGHPARRASAAGARHRPGPEGSTTTRQSGSRPESAPHDSGMPEPAPPARTPADTAARRTARTLRQPDAANRTRPERDSLARRSDTTAEAPGPMPNATARLHQAILSRLGPSPVAEDMLIRDLDRPAAEVMRGLVGLELDGHVQRHPGGLLSRTT